MVYTVTGTTLTVDRSIAGSGSTYVVEYTYDAAHGKWWKQTIGRGVPVVVPSYYAPSTPGTMVLCVHLTKVVVQISTAALGYWLRDRKEDWKDFVYFIVLNGILCRITPQVD